MPDLEFRPHCYDSDSDAESKVGRIEELYNLSENTEISLDASKVMVKWLLDADASIHADADRKNVEDEKSCDMFIRINIAEGNAIAPRGIGRKAIREAITKHPLLVQSIHVTLEFLKHVLSVSKLIDDGCLVEFTKECAVARNKSGKVIRCPRDTKKDSAIYTHLNPVRR
jgi:hypothetical protein